MRKPVDDKLNGQYGTAQVEGFFQPVASWLDSYCRAKTGLHAHLAGWRRLLEGPCVNICASFERDPKRGILPKSKLQRKARYLNGLNDVPGEMQFSVLVDIVQPADVRQRDASLLYEVAAPSLIRLKPLDRCPFAYRESADLSPPARGQRVAAPVLGLRVMDGKGGLPSDVGLSRRGGRDATTVMPDVHLVDEVVKGGTEIVVGVPEDQGQVSGQWLDLPGADTVLKSISMTLKSGGPSLSVIPPEDVVFDYSVVLSSPLQFSKWLVNAPASHRPSTKT